MCVECDRVKIFKQGDIVLVGRNGITHKSIRVFSHYVDEGSKYHTYDKSLRGISVTSIWDTCEKLWD